VVTAERQKMRELANPENTIEYSEGTARKNYCRRPMRQGKHIPFNESAYSSLGRILKVFQMFIFADGKNNFG
jgi:hypothetical protein